MLFSTLLAAATVASAAPTHGSGPLSLPLTRSSRGLDKRALVGTAGLSFKEETFRVAVEVGTPPQRLNAILDTAFNQFWLVGACADATECGGATPFEAGKSSSWNATQQQFTSSDAAGSRARGSLGADQTRVGGVTGTSSIGLASEVLDFGVDADGVIGFGLGSKDAEADTWWRGAAAKWEKKEFGLDLREPAELALGGVNDRFARDIKYHAVVDAPTEQTRNLWTVGDVKGAVKGQAVGSGAAGIVTSSFSLVIGPSAAVSGMYAGLGVPTTNESGLWAFQKPANGTKLDAGVAIGGDMYTMADADMCYTEILPEDVAHLKGAPNGTTWCYGAVQTSAVFADSATSSISSDINYWYIGTPILRNYYTAFRLDPPAVGFGTFGAEGSAGGGNSTQGSNPKSAAGKGASFQPALVALAVVGAGAAALF